MTLEHERIITLYTVFFEVILCVKDKIVNATTHAETALKNYKEVRGQTSDLECKYCRNQLEALSYCRDCACMLDELCVGFHKYCIIHLLKHRIISFEKESAILDFSPKLFCNLHHQELKPDHRREIEYYCFNCNMYRICSECLNAHKNHKYIRITNIEDLNTVLQDFIKVCCRAEDRYIQQFKDIIELICDDAICNHERQLIIIEKLVGVIRTLILESNTPQSGEHTQYVVQQRSDEQNKQANSPGQELEVLAEDVRIQQNGEPVVLQRSDEQNEQANAPGQELEVPADDERIQQNRELLVQQPSDEQNEQANAPGQELDVPADDVRIQQNREPLVHPPSEQNLQDKAPEQELEAFAADIQNHMDSFQDVHPPNNS